MQLNTAKFGTIRKVLMINKRSVSINMVLMVNKRSVSINMYETVF